MRVLHLISSSNYFFKLNAIFYDRTILSITFLLTDDIKKSDNAACLPTLDLHYINFILLW